MQTLGGPLIAHLANPPAVETCTISLTAAKKNWEITLNDKHL